MVDDVSNAIRGNLFFVCLNKFFCKLDNLATASANKIAILTFSDAG
jgi:hypothetical protein